MPRMAPRVRPWSSARRPGDPAICLTGTLDPRRLWSRSSTGRCCGRFPPQESTERAYKSRSRVRSTRSKVLGTGYEVRRAWCEVLSPRYGNRVLDSQHKGACDGLRTQFDAQELSLRAPYLVATQRRKQRAVNRGRAKPSSVCPPRAPIADALRRKSAALRHGCSESIHAATSRSRAEHLPQLRVLVGRSRRCARRRI